MNNIINRAAKIVVFAVFLGLIFAGAAYAAFQTTGGWAWSSNIGWIEFNPLNGGVFIDDTSGDFSGYAWSDNIGWISFESSDVSGCPSGTCVANVDLTAGGEVIGWAKALSASGGWDGFISMNCINTGTCATSDYKVSYNATLGEFSGYAWGSSVIGWLSFKGTSYGVITNPPANPECSDGADNDTNGCFDFPNDSGCTSASDNDESGGTCAPAPECSDTIDNDGDTYTDYADDPGCSDSTDTTESPNPQCSNNIDDDGDSLIDLADTCGCTSIYDDDETDQSIFSLSSSSGSIYVTLTGTSATEDSSKTTITVSSTCFSSAVVLSASSAIAGAVYNFSDASLDSSEYAAGSDFWVTVPSGTAAGLYDITVTGTGGGFTTQINVQLNIESFDPDFEEF